MLSCLQTNKCSPFVRKQFTGLFSFLKPPRAYHNKTKAFNKFEGLLFLSKYSGARTRGFFLLISSILSLTRFGHSICNVCNLRCYLVCKLTNVRLSSENSSQDCFLSSSPHAPTIKKALSCESASSFK